PAVRRHARLLLPGARCSRGLRAEQVDPVGERRQLPLDGVPELPARVPAREMRQHDRFAGVEQRGPLGQIVEVQVAVERAAAAGRLAEEGALEQQYATLRQARLTVEHSRSGIATV